MPKAPVVVTVVGRSNSGKTTLVECLVARLAALGIRVGTVKHASHRLDLDRPGKDTFRHRDAGALRTAALSPDMLFYVEKLEEGSPAPLLEEMVANLFQGMDLVIAESFSTQPFPRIEVLAPRQRTPIPKPLPKSDVLGRIRSYKKNDTLHFKEPELADLVCTLTRHVKRHMKP